MSSLKDQVKNLLSLQDIDTHIQVIRNEADEAPLRVADLEKRLGDKNARIDKAKEAIKALEARRTDLEDQIKESNRKTKRSQARASDVKNNRQHQAVLKELEDLKLIREDAEEILTGVVEELEDLNLELEAAQEGMPELQANLDAERSELESSVAKMEKQIAALSKDREPFTKKLPQFVLDRYHFIRSRLDDAAVAPVIDGTCQVCHIALPPQSFIELRRMEEIMTCPNCQRIIYWVGYDEA